MVRVKKRGAIRVLVLSIVCVTSVLIVFTLRNNYASAPKPNQLSVTQRSDEKVIEIKEYLNKPYEVGDLIELST
jgi:hypothetical protein